MNGNKVTGIDGITKEEYDWNLEENLEKLMERLKKKSYKLQQTKRVGISKKTERPDC